MLHVGTIFIVPTKQNQTIRLVRQSGGKSLRDTLVVSDASRHCRHRHDSCDLWSDE